jgi:hypothetical protein
MLGREAPPLPERPTDLQLQEYFRSARERAVYADFRDLFRTNEAFAKEKAIQLEADIRRRGVLLRDLDQRKAELIVANQTITYCQYLPEVAEQLISCAELFDQEFAELLPTLPPNERQKLVEQRRQTIRYLRALKDAMHDRVHYASIINLDKKIAELSTMPAQAEEVKRLQQVRADLVKLLSPATRETLERETPLREQYLRAGNEEERRRIFVEISRLRSTHKFDLDRKIIDILKGNPEGKPIEGAPKDFLPQRMYLQVIQLRYNQLHGIQLTIARDQSLSEQERREAQEILNQARTATMNQMVAATQLLAAHQVSMLEITAIQNQFGNIYDYTDARRPLESFTPAQVRELIQKSMDGAKAFHLERLQAMVGRINTAFDPNGLESMSDASIMALLRRADGISSTVRNLITALLPESAVKQQIDAFLNRNLPLAIQESLETGVGPDGKPLTKEQKLQRIRDVIIEFRNTGSIGRFTETLTVLQQMPPSSTYLGQEVHQPLPRERVTAENRASLIERHGGATVYAMILTQLREDGEGLQQSYQSFLMKMEQLVNIRLSLIAEVNLIKQGWMNLVKGLGIGAGILAALPWIGAAGGGALGTYVLWKGIPLALRASAATVRGVLRLATSPREALRSLGSAAGRAGRGVLNVPGVLTVLQGVRTYEDFRELGALTLSLEQQRSRITTELRQAGFEEDPQQPGRFVYKDGGVEIAVRVNELHEALEGHQTAQAVRTAADAAETAVLALIWAGRLSSRAFWPLAAAEVAVESVVYGINQAAQRRFLQRCPAWLLAKINMHGAVGCTPYDMLGRASEDMLTDPFIERSEEQKKDIREKMIFGLLHQELMEFPDLQREIYGGNTHPIRMQQFFEGEFKTIFLRLYYTRLFQNGNGRYRWSNLIEGKLDGWNLPVPAATPTVSQVEVRTALREAAILYAQHVREKQYRQALHAYNEFQRSGRADPSTEHLLRDLATNLGSQAVLGGRLDTVDPAVLSGNTKTRMHQVADYLFAHAPERVTSVPMAEVPGLTRDAAFPSLSAIVDTFTEDPALRMKLKRVIARDIDERSGQDRTRWYDRGGLVPEWKWPSEVRGGPGLLGGVDAARSLAIAAADRLRRRLGKPPLYSGPDLWTIFGARGDEPTTEAALLQLTRDAVGVFEERVSEGQRVEKPVRDPALEERIFRNKREWRQVPMVFRTGWAPSLDFCHALAKIPEAPGFKREDLCAIFFEERRLGGDIYHPEYLVLATYVYGDPRGRRVSVLQRAAIRAAIAVSGGEQVVTGAFEPVPASEFQRRPQILRMLNELPTGVQQREAEMREAEQRHRESEERAREAWEKARPERERQAAEQNARRQAALERARTSVGMLYVPGQYSQDNTNRRVGTDNGTECFAGSFGGRLIRIPSIPWPPVRGMSAARENSGTWEPRESDALIFTSERNGETYTHTVWRLADVDDNGGNDKLSTVMHHVLITPLTLTGHPQAGNPEFVQAVRRYELNRLLDLTTYRGSWSWGPREYRANLLMQLLPIYENLPDSTKRGLFLRALFNNLVTEGVVTKRSYDRIVKNLSSFREQGQ